MPYRTVKTSNPIAVLLIALLVFIYALAYTVITLAIPALVLTTVLVLLGVVPSPF